jgi:hypothetical protein
MNTATEALNTMGKYLDIATTRGSFNLSQCEQILDAIRIFRPIDDDTVHDESKQTVALNILAKYLNIATKAGVFDLNETKEITTSLDVFRKPAESTTKVETI